MTQSTQSLFATTTPPFCRLCIVCEATLKQLFKHCTMESGKRSLRYHDMAASRGSGCFRRGWKRFWFCHRYSIGERRV